MQIDAVWCRLMQIDADWCRLILRSFLALQGALIAKMRHYSSAVASQLVYFHSANVVGPGQQQLLQINTTESTKCLQQTVKQKQTNAKSRRYSKMNVTMCVAKTNAFWCRSDIIHIAHNPTQLFSYVKRTQVLRHSCFVRYLFVFNFFSCLFPCFFGSRIV